MMEAPLNVEQIQARFESVRRSEYFPAILGAVAGGVTGALMAGLISGGKRTTTIVKKDGETVASIKSGMLLGFSPRDLIQLTTLVASLIRQVKDWREEG